jgi:hypothetical protein
MQNDLRFFNQILKINYKFSLFNNRKILIKSINIMMEDKAFYNIKKINLLN